MIAKNVDLSMRVLRSAWVCGWLLMTMISVQAIGQELTADNLYNQQRIIDVAIAVPEEDWKLLCAQTRDPGKVFAGKIEDPFTYFKADVTIDGTTIKSVGVRKKGFIGSLDDHFPSLKVKFDEYEDQKPIADVDVLTLNNNKQDGPLVSQFVTYKLFNTAGIQAPRCNFARVTVNGEYLGIYSNVESIGKPFLKKRYGKASGNLYEGTLADFYPKAIDRIEVKSNKKDHDNSKIARLAELLAAEGPLDVDAVSDLIDMDTFLRYWAMESLTGFWDGYCNNQNNYWLYENPGNGKLYFIPWGADATFMPGGFPGFGPRGPLSVYTESMLTNRLFNDQQMATRYKQSLEKILAEVWKEDELLKSIDELEQFLTPHLHARQMGAPRSMKSMRQFIKRRRKMIEGELENWPVTAPPQPRKPMYIVHVGKASGSFATSWADRPPKDVAAVGKLTLNLEVDGQPIKIEHAGATVSPPSRNGFPGFGGPFAPMKPTGNVMLGGVKANDEGKFQIVLSVHLDVLEKSAGQTIEVDGSFTDDIREGGPFSPFSGRTVTGSLTLAKVGLKAGETIEGEFDLTISQVRGGFFSRGAPQAP